MTWADTLLLVPELLVAAGASVLLLIPVLGGRSRGHLAKWVMLGLMAVTAMAVIGSTYSVAGLRQTPTFRAMFAVDAFSVFFKLLFVVVIALVTLLSEDFLSEERYSTWEYYSLLAFALCGMMFMASGVHLITIYIGLELLSLSSYILAGYYKNHEESTEAAMKYFILGAVSSAILLYGISLIYGVCGSLRLSTIGVALSTMLSNDALMFGIMLLAAGLCFKIAAVPFHVWTPDVYVGAPTPITAFLSTGSKAAAFAVFARVFYVALPAFHLDWSNVLAAIAALSMIVGNLAAITQNNIKRMLAYSSISHAGYALLGIIAMNEMGLRGILIYTLVYVFANLGIWATILMLRRHAYAGESIEDFRGLHRRSPFAAFSMVVFLLSLGGIPPTAGFVGKYFLFAAAVQSGFGWLAVVAVVMSAVSMFYYLRLVVAMYLQEGVGGEETLSTASLRFVTALSLAVTLVIGFVPELPIRQVIESSGHLVVHTAQR